MKSKTSYFNRTLFTNLYKRFWPIFLAYILVWAAVLPIGLNSNLRWNSYSDAEFNPILRAAYYVLTTGYLGGALISAVFAMLIAMAAFSYLYNSRSVSMMCSLPIKREGVFISVFTAGFVGMFVSNILIILITLAIEAMYGAVGISYLLQWFAMVFLCNLFFYGFATLCASLTGHILVMPVVFIILNFTAFVVETIIRTVTSFFIYGVSSSGLLSTGNLLYLTPILRLTATKGIYTSGVDLPNGAFQPMSYQYLDWKILGLYALVGIVFAVLAMLLIRHRRMETAGDVVAVKPLKPIFKYCLTLGCALVFGAILFSITISNGSRVGSVSNMLIMLVYMLIGAFIGYFAAEMLMQKTLRVFAGKNWIGLLITAAVITGLMFCGEYDVFGYEKRLPNASEVQGVSISVMGEEALLELPENIEAAISLQNDIVTNKAKNEELLQSPDYDYNTYNVNFVYTMKNGKLIERYYNLCYEQNGDIAKLNSLMNFKEAIDNRKAIDVEVNAENVSDAYIDYFDKNAMTHTSLQLSSEDAYELYSACIVPDIDDENLGKIWLNSDSTDYLNTVYSCRINMNFSQRISDGKYKSDYFYTTATVNSQRTNQWLKEHGIELLTEGEVRKLYEHAELTEDERAYAEKTGVITPQVIS